jgi:hypothetical protein
MCQGKMQVKDILCFEDGTSKGLLESLVFVFGQNKVRIK